MVFTQNLRDRQRILPKLIEQISNKLMKLKAQTENLKFFLRLLNMHLVDVTFELRSWDLGHPIQKENLHCFTIY